MTSTVMGFQRHSKHIINRRFLYEKNNDSVSRQNPSVDASSPNNFYDLNQGTIGLHIGRLTEQGLKESALAFMSDDKEKAAIANKVASRLKNLTKAGAIAVNPVNGNFFKLVD